MNLRIVYTNNAGGLVVLIPADCGLTIEEIAAKDVPKGTRFKIVDTTSIPDDRLFRNAWVDSGGLVGIDTSKAKLITHEKRRIKRAVELAPLDIEATIPAKAKAAEAARKVIRDKHDAMQIEIDACTTSDELKAIITRESL